MALKPCRECKRDVSTSAAKCPHCGTPHPTTSMSTGAQGCLGCLGLVVLLGVIGSLLGSPSEGPASTSDSAVPSRAMQMYAPQNMNVRRAPSVRDDVAYTLNRRDITYVGRDTTSDGWAAVYSGPAALDTVGYVKRSLLVQGTPPPLPKLEIVDHRFEPERYGDGWIVGRIRNNSGRAYGYVQVQINLLRNGVVVGSTMTNVNNLAPGQIWQFRAPVFESFTHYRIEDITGF
ncbi:MAG: FxLYD domain-containing protein [Rhodanobacter sp.]